MIIRAHEGPIRTDKMLGIKHIRGFIRPTKT